MVRFTLRLPDNLHDTLDKTREQNRRSLNSEILRAVEYYLKNAPEAHYDPIIKPAQEAIEKTS